MTKLLEKAEPDLTRNLYGKKFPKEGNSLGIKVVLISYFLNVRF
jgi:hypothetical protein